MVCVDCIVCLGVVRISMEVHGGVWGFVRVYGVVGNQAKGQHCKMSAAVAKKKSTLTTWWRSEVYKHEEIASRRD